MSLVNPYLIQRCKVKNYFPKAGQMFSDCIELDYMGSSEFEWGIIPKTISALHAKSKEMRVYKYNGGIDLFILCLPEQEAGYQEVLKNLLSAKIRTKEYVFSKHALDVTLWMDLDNQVVFATDKNLLKKLPMLWTESQKKIEHNQKIKVIYEKLAEDLDLHDLHKALPGTVAVCGTDINDCAGTKALIGQTKYEVVYWLNGPRLNGRWVCGYYTAESIQEYIATKTGAIAEYIRGIKESKAS